MGKKTKKEKKSHHQRRTSRERNVMEKKKSKQTAGSMKICQNSEIAEASWISRKQQHQTRMPRATHVTGKDFQEITQSTAVPARRSRLAPIGFPFSLDFPALETSVTRLARDLLVFLYFADLAALQCTDDWLSR